MTAPDSLEHAIVAGAVGALRGRADLLRQRAAADVDVLDRVPVVLVVASEAVHALRAARDWDRIAAELEAEVAA